MSEPYYADDLVTLYHADCRDVLPTLTDVDALATDPPYGVGLGQGDQRGGVHGLGRRAYASFDDSYERFVAEVVPALNTALDRVTRGGIWTGPHIHEQRKPAAIGGIYCAAGCGRNVWGFKSFLPLLLYGMSPTVALGKGATVPTVIASSERVDRGAIDHPVPKPLGWMRWVVRLVSLPNELILDPFAGSGTTGLAARLEGRRAILIEREERYCELAASRLARLPQDDERTGQQALFGGEQ